MADASHSPRAVVDLHTHSNASDGVLVPAELVRQAAALGLQVIALTDHDTTAGVAEALRAGAELGVEVIPAVEFGTTVEAGELHLLGYGIDVADVTLQQVLEELREGRRRRVERIVARLNEAGVPIALDEVRALAGEGAIGRAHVARVLVQRGLASSIDEAFARFLSRGRPGYVSRPGLTAEEAIDAVHAAGGVAVLAHPYSVVDLERTLPRLVADGLDGLETFYANFDELQRAALAVLAARFGLLPTGGSDFHGIDNQEGRVLGSAPVPLATVDELRRLLAERGRRRTR